MFRRFRPFLLLLFLLSSCDVRPVHTLGVAPAASPTPVANLKPSAQPIVVQGTLTEKCPIPGCWFLLRDKTGVVKVDTKAAGFVAADVPVGATVTVTGTLRTTPERRVAATGMRY